MSFSDITWVQIGALIVALIATITDIRTGKIYNWLTLPAMLVGIIAQSVQFVILAPDKPIVSALGGAANGFLGCVIGMLMLGIFKMTIMRKFGGGDIKLMGALGAFVGWKLLVATFLCYCFAFGVYTCFVMSLAFPWRQLAVAYAAKEATVLDLEKFNKVRKSAIPVAPFIGAGLLVSVLFQHTILLLLGLE